MRRRHKPTEQLRTCDVRNEAAADLASTAAIGATDRGVERQPHELKRAGIATRRANNAASRDKASASHANTADAAPTQTRIESTH